MYGKTSAYPYYFIATRGKADTFTSGVFKTKKACREAMNSYGKNATKKYRKRLIDRRGRKK